MALHRYLRLAQDTAIGREFFPAGARISEDTAGGMVRARALVESGQATWEEPGAAAPAFGVHTHERKARGGRPASFSGSDSAGS